MLHGMFAVFRSLEPDTPTYLGQGDLDSTSGAGNDIRFDFASMGILPDGGSFIAYHDSIDLYPLFGVELLLPVSYGASSIYGESDIGTINLE